jgi:uncharacterized protein
MLYRLELQNFYSVREPQIIDLQVPASVPHSPDRFAPLHPGSEVRVPKVVALFGANASGKSTVLRALTFLSWFVQHSFQLPPASDQPAPATGFQPCERFFATEAATEPTRMCVHFTGPINFSAPAEEWKTFCRYAYEVSFESAAGKPRNVLHESFRQWPNVSGRSLRVFDRDAKGNVVAGKSFSLAGYRNVIDKVRSNTSIVSTLAQFDHKPSLMLRQVAAKVISNILVEKFELADSAILQWYNTPQTLGALNSQLERIDVGIKGMRLVPGPQGPMAFFDHEGLSVPVQFGLESHGTRQFVRIFPIIAPALAVGGVAVIDELDQSIHPFVLLEIIRWFHDSKRNPNDAQLWMTCQNAAVLEELEKEEVFFSEKDNQGRTKLFGLQDIQSVRRSDNFFKKYLGGVYGAVPHLG